MRNVTNLYKTNKQLAQKLQIETVILKNDLTEAKNDAQYRNTFHENITGELYKFKGDKISSINFKKMPKSKKYVIYSPQLKLLIYSENENEYDNNKRTLMDVCDIEFDTENINDKIGNIWHNKWFIIKTKQQRIILFGCNDINKCREWCVKIKNSLKK